MSVSGARDVDGQPALSTCVAEQQGRPREDTGVVDGLKRTGIAMLAGLFLMVGGGGMALAGGVESLAEPTSAVTVQDLQRYDGFEDYAAQGQQMENSDVGCFANECKRETASCFTDGSCLKVGETCCVWCIEIPCGLAVHVCPRVKMKCDLCVFLLPSYCYTCCGIQVPGRMCSVDVTM